MLIVSRKIEEGLRIGENIEIKVLDVYTTDSSGKRKSKAASIGIRAPREISILRKELYDTGEQNKRADQSASNVSQSDLAALLRKRQRDSSK